MFIRTPIIGIQRTPITGIVERVPITGINRVAIIGLPQDSSGEELKWDDIYAKLINYIKFAAKQVSEQYQTGTVNSSEDLFQEGQLLLYHCFTIYKEKSMEQFSALFKASLWRKLRELGKKKQPVQVSIEDSYDIGYSNEIVDDVYSEYKLQLVAEKLENNPIALTILKEFINPSSRTIWEASMDIARKSMLKEQNYSISVPKSIVIKGSHIQRALEISKSAYTENFKIVRDTMTSIYFKETDVSDDEVEEVLQKCV